MTLYCAQQGQGENLVLLHGWGMNSAVWADVLPQLQSRYCVHGIDLPGHGRSEVLETAGDSTVDVLAVWLDALDAVLPPRFHLCGWSLGGMLALAIQQRWPERVQGLVLLAASPHFLQADNWPGEPLENLHNFADSLSNNTAATLRQFFTLQFLGVPDARQTMRSLLQGLAAQGQVTELGMQQGLLLLKGLDLRPGFANHPCAVLLGGQDRLVPAALGEAMQNLNAACECEIWPKSGHAPHLARPADVAAYIDKHLQAVR